MANGSAGAGPDAVRVGAARAECGSGKNLRSPARHGPDLQQNLQEDLRTVSTPPAEPPEPPEQPSARRPPGECELSGVGLLAPGRGFWGVLELVWGGGVGVGGGLVVGVGGGL